MSNSFYERREWRELRYRVLRKYGFKCQACGADKNSGTVIHVDHIKPKHSHPELALDENNLQVLCADCNLGKSHKYDDDFRDVNVGDKPNVDPKSLFKRLPKAELFLLNIALKRRFWFEKIWGTGIADEMTSLTVKTIFRTIHEISEKDHKEANSEITKIVQENEMLQLAFKEPFKSLSDDELEKLITDCIRQIRERYLRKKSSALSDSLSGLRDSEKLNFLTQIMLAKKAEYSGQSTGE